MALPLSAEQKSKIECMKQWQCCFFPSIIDDFLAGESCIVCMRGPMDNGSKMPLYYCMQCGANPTHSGVCAAFLGLAPIIRQKKGKKGNNNNKYPTCLGCVLVDAEANVKSDDAIKTASCGICLLPLSATDTAEEISASIENKRMHQPPIVHQCITKEEGVYAHVPCALAARNSNASSLVLPTCGSSNGTAFRAHSSNVNLDQQALDKIVLPECEHCAKKQNQDGSLSRVDDLVLPRRRGLLMRCSHVGCSKYMHPNCAVQDNSWQRYNKLEKKDTDALLLQLKEGVDLPPVLPDDLKSRMYMQFVCSSHKDLPNEDSMVGVVGASNSKTMSAAAGLLDEERGDDDDDSSRSEDGEINSDDDSDDALSVENSRFFNTQSATKGEEVKKKKKKKQKKKQTLEVVDISDDDTASSDEEPKFNLSVQEELEKLQQNMNKLQGKKQTYTSAIKCSLPLKIDFNLKKSAAAIEILHVSG